MVDYDSDSATNSFNSTITIDGGHLDVIIDEAFVIDNATINMNGAPGTSAILGSRNAMAIGNDAGVLDAYGVEMIGAKVGAVKMAEDRLLFKQAMKKIKTVRPWAGPV